MPFYYEEPMYIVNEPIFYIPQCECYEYSTYADCYENFYPYNNIIFYYDIEYGFFYDSYIQPIEYIQYINRYGCDITIII